MHFGPVKSHRHRTKISTDILLTVFWIGIHFMRIQFNAEYESVSEDSHKNKKFDNDPKLKNFLCYEKLFSLLLRL
jgi:hypothetical protein